MTSRCGPTLLTLPVVTSYGDVATLTWQRKGDVFPEQGEAVVMETQVLQKKQSKRKQKTTTTSEQFLFFLSLLI
jgi:hypothetical protein